MLPARKASAAVAALAFASGLVAVLSTGSAGTMQDRAVTALPPEVSVAVRPLDAPPAEVPAAILTSVRSAGEETDAEPATRLPSTDSLITLNAHPTRPQYPDAPCMIRTSAKPQSGAAVRLQASATCLPESRVTVHHGGMLFTELTDADGTIDIVVPALAERAVFMLTFEGEQMAMAVTRVPDLAGHHRIVLQWQGDAGLALAPRGSGTGLDPTGSGGQLVRLGNPASPMPMQAEVFSRRVTTQAEDIADGLGIEVQVTETNCGREIIAQSLRLDGGVGMTVQPLALTIPACDAVGDHLLLNILMEDQKIAAR